MRGAARRGRRRGTVGPCPWLRGRSVLTPFAPGADARLACAQFVTDFGDQAVLLPLAAGIALVFALAGWRRGAAAWVAAVVGTLAVMVVFKLVFLACGHLLPGNQIHSPSGHTAAAAAIYGGLLALAARLATGHGRWTLACALLVTAVIGASRLALGVHTGLEVAVGGAVGVCGALVADRLAGAPPPGLRTRRLAAVTVLVLALLHGVHMPAEAVIRSAALDLWPLTQCR